MDSSSAFPTCKASISASRSADSFAASMRARRAASSMAKSRGRASRTAWRWLAARHAFRLGNFGSMLRKVICARTALQGRCALAGVLLLISTAASAQTAPDDRYPSWANRMQGYQRAKEWRWGASKKQPRVRPDRGEVVGGRPAGCPHRFCGCALALKIFGRNVRELWLAANWLTFPRVAPAPGMVAARRGHVFQLIAHSGGSTWRVFDPNSGRGRVRIHDRSIAGYAIVNPTGQTLSARRRGG